MKRKILAFICAAALILSLAACAQPETAAPAADTQPETSTSETAKPETAQPETTQPETTEPENNDAASQEENPPAETAEPTDIGEAGSDAPSGDNASAVLTAENLNGASALYVTGQSVTMDDATFLGHGFATDQQQTDQIPNMYGMCSVVLAVGEGAEITLNNPTIESFDDSYSNGVFAAGLSKIVVNGGTITTNNSCGHGIDATYMGHVYAYDTVISTHGDTSGALATDFGGGFVTCERLDCTTEGGSSPGIFCAGSSIITLKDSKLNATGATGVVVAHDHSVLVLENTEVIAAGTAITGLQALPDANSSEGSVAFVFGGSLTSTKGAVVGESGGRTEVNLVGVECSAGGSEAISAMGSSVGILTVNLWDTELTGNISCGEKCTVTVNIYAGGKLTGEVEGDGAVTINVYDGGEYVGSFASNAMGAGKAAPQPMTFDEYLVNYWATGSMTWTSARGKEFAEKYEPIIMENSADVRVVEGAAAKAYDPSTYDPSENGIDLSLLNIGGAHGFTVGEVFGGGEGEATSGEESSSGDTPEGDAPAEGTGESSSGDAPAEGDGSEATSGESGSGEANS